MSTKTEIIVWHPVSEKLPDDDTTVMLSHPQQDEPVWLGYHHDGAWHEVQGGLLPQRAVTHWADMPMGV